MNGIVINIDPVLFQVGAFSVRWYSLAIVAGLFTSVWVARSEAKRKGLDVEKVTSLAVWAIVAGFFGARLFHVLDQFEFYAANPAQILQVQKGGLAIWGGLASGGLAGLAYARRSGLSIAKTADVAAVAVLVGQVVGRIGCIVNGDAYGGATTLPWGFIYTNPGAMIPDALRGIPTHPYPVYEMLWDVALLFGLWRWRKHANTDGALFLAYAAVYGLGRFLLTFVRQEREVLLGLQQAQVIGLALIAGAGAWMAYLRRRPAPAVATGPAARPSPRGRH